MDALPFALNGRPKFVELAEFHNDKWLKKTLATGMTRVLSGQELHLLAASWDFGPDVTVHPPLKLVDDYQACVSRCYGFTARVSMSASARRPLSRSHQIGCRVSG